MKRFLLGLSILWIGSIGALITYIYTLLHQGSLNGKDGWLINFITNDTGIPFLIFLMIMAVGIAICIYDMKIK